MGMNELTGPHVRRGVVAHSRDGIDILGRQARCRRLSTLG
jgi:hypothetical protein